MADDIAIRVSNVSKTFKLPHDKRTSVKSVFVNFFRRQTYENQLVLNNVSFEIKKGEFFGIVGRNGSGKSTLLKLLAEIYYPTKGHVKINGSLTPFIELGVGFNPELTGRENTFLNGALLGFNRKQISAMYQDIVEFAELEKFMDQKLKNYSSGMQVRLAFSIAIRAKSNILLLDEVLAVGDAAFQQKCYDYFFQLKKEKRTIVLVSHNMQIIERFCSRALLLENGVINSIGSSAEIAEKYDDLFLKEERLAKIKNKSSADKEEIESEIDSISIEKVITAQDGKATDNIRALKAFSIEVVLKSKVDINKLNLGINIKNRENIMVVATDTRKEFGDMTIQKNKDKTIIFNIENILTNGLYEINIGIADYSNKMDHLIKKKRAAHEFTVHGIIEHENSMTHPKVKVTTG